MRRLVGVCTLLSLFLPGCGSDPTVTDTLPGTYELVSIDNRALPYTLVDYTGVANSAQYRKYELLSARMILQGTEWREESVGRFTLDSGVGTETTSDAGTWERVGDKVVFYDVRGFYEGEAAIVGSTLSVSRGSPIARGRTYLYQK